MEPPGPGAKPTAPAQLSGAPVNIAQLTIDGKLEILGHDGEYACCLDEHCEGCAEWRDGRFDSIALRLLRATLDAPASRAPGWALIGWR